jgi:hypothetical protein
VSQGSQSVQVTATVPNGTAPGTAYSKTFTITLTYTDAGSIGTNPVTGLRWLWALDLGVGDTYDLRSRVIIETANGLPPAYNGRLVTHDDLVFSINYATPGSMSLSETKNRKLTANAVGSGDIDVKLPAGVGAATEIPAPFPPLAVTVKSKSVGGGLFGIHLNILKVNNSNKNRPSDFNKAVVVRYYHSDRPCPYGGISGTFTTGKTGQTWDDQPGFTGVNKLRQKYAADNPALSVHYNGLPDDHQASSQGIWGRWWTYTYGSTGPSQALCCDIWFVDKADNVYGYLDNADIAPAHSKILHLHLMGAGDSTRPELWGSIWDVHVNTNVDSPQWGDVQIVRHGAQTQ